MIEETYSKILLAWIILGLVVFFVNLKIVAPYGRHASNKWGILINNRLAWIIMESPVLLLVLYFIIPKINRLDPVVLVLAFLFIAHYIHRTLVFPFRIRAKSNKMPIGVIALAIMFNLFNGLFIGYYLANFASYNSNWFMSFSFISGAFLFSIGVYINWRADNLLIGLRDDKFTGYKIPSGFLFDKISCPNHLGEIIEWFGYALMSFNLPALAFAIWTAANLIPRAVAHHKWYKINFKDYPRERKAILPRIW